MGLTFRLGQVPLAVFTDSSNNVGIGGSPSGSYKFEVTGAGRFTGALTGGSTITAGGTVFAPNTITDPTTGNATSNGTVYALNSASTTNSFGIGIGAIRNSAYDMWFQTGPTNGGGYRWYIGTTERMTLSSTGDLGIGTSSIYYASTNRKVLEINGASSSFLAFKVGDTPKSYLFQNGADFIITNLANAGGYLALENNGAERMRITSGGLVGIANSGINAVRLGVTYGGGGSIAVGIAVQDVDNASNSQYMQFLNAATTAIGSISRNGGFNQINYNTTSDYRLKEDFKDFNGLDKVSLIKVYDHKWIDFDGRTTGVIAHELQEVIPYAVTGEKDAVDEKNNIKPQQVDYSKLVPVLVKAIQELNAKVSALENKS